ncbi:tyrosine-type recombinase/integrase [Anaerosolibacter sp.]|uniref:tyrosine-type recombinase/integrase n=1 Tax=Anaerosolibacter sp. TaxID=1872527 RepID=UPI0039EFB2D5
MRKTIGWDDNGKQIFQNLGYYESRKEALEALVEFNKNPYSIESSTITFSELYDKWKEGKFEGISRSAINGYNASFDVCKSLHHMKFVEIKTKHMQDIIRTCGKGHGTLRKIKVLFNQLFKFAMENDIVSKDYSQFVDIGKNTEESTRVPFTKAEIERLFEVEPHMEWVDTVLIMIYTGLRIGELLLIKNKNVDLQEAVIKGGIKTEAGKNRMIPINRKILPMVTKRASAEHEYLIVNHENKKMSYYNYYEEKWKPLMEQLGMNHKPHDCRHTFATLMNNADANQTAIKKLIGHSSFATTEKIYTHKDIEELRKAIESI